MGELDRFVELLDEARAQDAAAARRRERWLRVQAEEEAQLAATLRVLAEDGLTVSLRTIDGRRHAGQIQEIGADFVAVGTAQGRRAFVALGAVSVVRSTKPEPFGQPLEGCTCSWNDACLVERLAELVGERPKIAVVAQGEPEALVGELQSVGRDVVVVASDGLRSLCYVAIPSLTEVTVLTSG